MLRIVLGFAIGCIIARNAQPMAFPFWGAIILGAIAGMVLFYFFGRRDKNIAVATAVAIAIAEANAKADARAQAIANSAVNVYMATGQVPDIHAVIDSETVEDEAYEINDEYNRAFSRRSSVDPEFAKVNGIPQITA